MDELWYEDFRVGETYEFDPVRVDEDDIVEFATRYDPLSFHTDAGAASESRYGGLIASGIQTMALSQSQVVDGLYGRSHIIGSLGFESVRFPRPVRPGDRLTTHIEVLDRRVSESDPSRGIVTTERTVVDGADAVVFEAVNNVLFERRSTNSPRD
ncbi:MaoC family dehydratase [Halovivax cerinus]|uniref:MaoC family dehydratase n=1 Tax=Halovivax cerinus TaxID=1487865 RepID=A0ABD5NJB1_9EURY|nr:MaoC family dehydratase [Halovivax cerinus]